MSFNQVLFVGTGGTGGILAPLVCRLMEYHPLGTTNITLCDGDIFEPHNANRQLANEQTLGKNKATVTAQMIYEQGLEIPNVIPNYLSSSSFKRELDAEDDGTIMIILAVDNDATRAMTLNVLEEHKRDFVWISPGNAGADDPASAIKGQVIWYGRIGDQTLGLHPAELFPNIAQPSDHVPKKGTCSAQAPSSPQLLSANAAAAALTLAVIQNMLDCQLPDSGNTVYFNYRNFTTSL